MWFSHRVCKILGVLAFIVSLGLTAFAPAQEGSIELHGDWTASEGPTRTFWGTWEAQLSPDKPNEAEGSWALRSDTGEAILEGMWSANKARVRWQGAWVARTLAGQSLAGTWTADITGSGGKTFLQMLQWTMEKDILGSWRAGRYQGKWRLKGSPLESSGRLHGRDLVTGNAVSNNAPSRSGIYAPTHRSRWIFHALVVCQAISFIGLA